MQIFRVCSIFVAVLYGIGGQQNVSVYLALLHRLQQPDYIASIRPTANEGPVVVEVDVELKSIGPVSEAELTWTTSFFLRQEWTDVRLKLDADRAGGAGGAGGGGGGAGSVVKLREDSVDSVWQPDLFFSNSKEGLRHQLTVPNRLFYVNVSTGEILSSQRLTMVLNCKMDLVKFPHDHQTCSLVMESYSYTTDDMILKWSSKRTATDLQPTIYIPDFDIKDITASDCTKTYAIGTYPCLQVTVEMSREVGYYICYTFLPTILIVILSWASFWIDHDAAPARVSVGLLTVLTITTQLAGSSALLPKVPYIKAIDVWMSINLIFVFAAYMEYPVVTVLSRRYRKTDIRTADYRADEEEGGQKSTETPSSPTLAKRAGLRQPPKRRMTLSEIIFPRPLEVRRPSILPPNLDSNDTGRQLDKKCRVLFPLAFAIFNIVYWVYYMV